MAIKESVTIDEVLEVLNRATKVDREAVSALIAHRVPCCKELADDPTIQVAAAGADGRPARVGMLGILNGVFGIDDQGWGPIAVVIEDDGDGPVREFVRSDSVPPDIPLDPDLSGKVKTDAR